MLDAKTWSDLLSKFIYKLTTKLVGKLARNEKFNLLISSCFGHRPILCKLCEEICQKLHTTGLTACYRPITHLLTAYAFCIIKKEWITSFHNTQQQGFIKCLLCAKTNQRKHSYSMTDEHKNTFPPSLGITADFLLTLAATIWAWYIPLCQLSLYSAVDDNSIGSRILSVVNGGGILYKYNVWPVELTGWRFFGFHLRGQAHVFA